MPERNQDGVVSHNSKTTIPHFETRNTFIKTLYFSNSGERY